MADQYEWTATQPLNRDDPVEQGETFEPTDAEVRAYSDLMRPVESDSDDSHPDESGEDEDDEIDERAIELADEDYQDAVDAVKSGEADEYLGDLEDVDDRSTVQDAIEARREELEVE